MAGTGEHPQLDFSCYTNSIIKITGSHSDKHSTQMQLGKAYLLNNTEKANQNKLTCTHTNHNPGCPTTAGIPVPTGTL